MPKAHRANRASSRKKVYKIPPKKEEKLSGKRRREYKEKHFVCESLSWNENLSWMSLRNLYPNLPTHPEHNMLHSPDIHEHDIILRNVLAFFFVLLNSFLLSSLFFNLLWIINKNYFSDVSFSLESAPSLVSCFLVSLSWILSLSKVCFLARSLL